MTVDELRDLLSELDGETQVVVSCDDDTAVKHFEVGAVLLQKGIPTRDEDRQPQFEVNSIGSATWLFISITTDA